MKVGDRVIGKSSSYKIADKIGTIINIISTIISVEFDDHINGHDCPNNPVQGKDGHCWNCNEIDLEVTNQEPKYEIY